MIRRGQGIFVGRMTKYLALVLLIISTSSVEASDPIFTEGGGVGPYQLEEEILEELSKGQQQQQEKLEEKELSGFSFAGKPQAKPTDDETKEEQRPVQSAGDSKPKPAYNNAKEQYDELKSAAAAAIMKQQQTVQQQKPQQRPQKQKKEGQMEFPTFVDPIAKPVQSHYARAEKQRVDHPHADKRAPIGPKDTGDDFGDTVFIAVTTVCSAAAVFGLIGAGVCWYRLHKQYRAAQEVEYPHYGVTGPAKERTSGSNSPIAAMDAKLASSAQLYHYQHTKQQIIAMEHSTSDAKGQESEDSEGEGDEGDFSVYECPGLAPTGDIEVSNPLFENVASPHTKTDPRQHDEAEMSPRVHQRSPTRGEDP